MSTPTHDEYDGDEIEYDEPFRMVPDSVSFHPTLKDVDVRVFIALAWFARTGRAYPGRKAIAKKIRKTSIRTIDESLNRLIVVGALTVIPRYREDGGRRSSLYRLHRELLAEGQRSARPGRDVKKSTSTPSAENCAGDKAENCPESQAEDCPPPEQNSAREINETNGKGYKQERNLVADATSVADPAPATPAPAGEDGTLDLDGVHSAPPKKKTSAKKAKTPAPDRMEITLAMRAWARDNKIQAELVAETAQFLDNHRSKGNEFVDWDAAWRTWMRNSKKFGPGGWNGAPGNHLPVDTNDEANEQNRAAFG